ncbi:MAG: hypothetical protein Q9165_005901 [Trypethelium subeluteriae]
MADWRTRGVVEDSEEEEDPINNESQSRVQEDANPCTSSVRTGHNGNLHTKESQDRDHGLREEQDHFKHSDPPSKTRVHIAQPASVARSQDGSPEKSASTTELSQYELPDVQLLKDSQVELGLEHTVPNVWSGASSPLSDVPSTLEDPPIFISSQHMRLKNKDLVYDSSDTNIQLQEWQNQAKRGEPRQFIDIDCLDPQHVAVELSRHRSFRKRNPIQLHPYLLEGERYRKTMRARGVRPVHLANPAAEREASGQVSDNDPNNDVFSGYNSSSPPRYTQTTSSPPVRDRSQNSFSEPQNATYAQPLPNSDDDLPDINAVLRRGVPALAQHHQKRRKLSHVSIPGNGTRPQRPATQDPLLPLSPPTSGREVIPDPSESTISGFRLPPGMVSLATMTPAQSSQIGQSIAGTASSRAEENAYVASSRGRTSSRRHRQIVISSESSNSDSECSPGDSDDLQRFQKRIKGVLPASWLKLDKQSRFARKHKSNLGNRHPPSPSRAAEPQRGVARKRITNVRTTISPQKVTSSTLKTRFNCEMPNDVDQSTVGKMYEEAITQRKSPDARGTPILAIFEDEPDTSDMETACVDPMLSSATLRRNPSAKRNGKKQKKLTDFRPLEGLGNDDRAGCQVLSRVHSGAKGGHHRKQKNPSSRKLKSDGLPRLSIIDIQPRTNKTASRTPQFIRIAARQARRRIDHGRHSARGKYIQLHTMRDTEDANATLHAWRAGIIATSENDGLSTSASARPPLQARQSNQQSTGISPIKSGQEDATGAGSARVRSSNTKTSSIARQWPFNARQLSRLAEDSKSPGQQSSIKQAHRFRLAHYARDAHPLTRAAQLEALELAYDTAHPEIAFRRKLSRLDHSGSFPRIAEPTAPPQPQPPSRRPRKDKDPTRIDVETRPYRQPVEPLPNGDTMTVAPNIVADTGQPLLQGLGPYGTHYATNFDVFPLQVGTYFHQSTFVGSGAFSEALNFTHRRLDEPAVATAISYDKDQWMWSCWDSRLESQLETIVAQLAEGRSPSSDSPQNSVVQSSQTLSNIIRWVSRSLFFLDPIDRGSILSKTLYLCKALWKGVMVNIGVCSQEQPFQSPIYSSFIEILTRVVVLVNQALQISIHSEVDDKLQEDWRSLVVDSCGSLLQILLSKGLGSLRSFQERNRQHALRETGIRQEDIAVECVVVLKHVLGVAFPEKPMFWELVNKYYMQQVEGTTDARVFDCVWYDVFTLLPFLELDRHGLLVVGSRYQSSVEDWSLIRALLKRLCPFVRDGGRSPGSTINAYFRATLTRCFNLVQTWGWRKCDTVLGIFFDFFAQNRLGSLHNEQSNRSPIFLEQLDQDPDLSLQPGESSFHIFLRMLALGLKRLRTVHTETRLRSIVWRFIPNHGRIHRKEDDLQQGHLDALRNHHDILCTLYWAVPPPCRPRLDLIRNLVDHAHSHREACRLNVRSWSNLVRFLVSNDEPTSTLESFALWHHDIIQANLDQYRLARSEAEAQYQQANLNEKGTISGSLLESTIASNQRQVVAIIRDALSSMASAVRSARKTDEVESLLKESSLLKLLGTASFKSTDRALYPIVFDSLDIVSMSVDCHTVEGRPSDQQASDESQEYGDWSGFETVDLEGITFQPSWLTFLFDTVKNLVSNAFGSEDPPEDSLLVKIVDVWVSLAKILVRQGFKDWCSYFGPYGTWTQMRETEQKRRYTPYFLTQVVKTDPARLRENSSAIKACWAESLVERESKLHYQSHLTATLLHFMKDDHLLNNLPFVARPDGTYDIALAEFRERRLSTIAALLWNVRRVFENSHDAANDLGTARSECTLLLHRLQSSMKRNYEEMQRDSTSSGQALSLESPELPVAERPYVTFVHNVVSLLQQYTNEFHPVDRFFTDSTAFPLPATDPSYVVGRLKSYSLRLKTSDGRTFKQLATFILTMSQRAADERQQVYLASQMRTAMRDAREHNAEAVTLRRVLLLGIFPAFIECGLEGGAGIVLARPILWASTGAFEDLLEKFSVFDRKSAEAAIDLCTTFLHILGSGVQQRLSRGGLLLDSCALNFITLVYEAVAAILPLLDYLCRATGAVWCAYNMVASFICMAGWIKGSLDGALNEDVPSFPGDPQISDKLLEEVHAFCSSEVGKAVEGGSKLNHGNFCRRPGAGPVVVAEGGLIEEDGANLSNVIKSLETGIRKTSGGVPVFV